MSKYWGKQIFAHGRFPEVGQKQKTEKKRESEKERLNNGNYNGQATNGTRKHAWRTQTTWANFSHFNVNSVLNLIFHCPMRIIFLINPFQAHLISLVKQKWIQNLPILVM